MPLLRSLPVLLVCLIDLPGLASAAESFRFPTGRWGDKAELKYVNKIPVLIVAGMPEEMGQAVGTLALKPGARTLAYPRDLLKARSAELLWGLFVQGGKRMLPQFPADYQKEMESMARAAGAAYDDLVVGNTLFDLKKMFLCSALLVEGKRSSTGAPLLARNLDYPSLGYIHQYSLVTIYRPRGKHAFAAVGFPGLVGCLTGMNDAGLCVGVLEVFDAKSGEPRFNSQGIPYALCYRKLLEECTTIAEAKKLLRRLPRTTTTNLVLADRQGVAVFEITPKQVVQRDAEQGVSVCTNHFRDPRLKPAQPLNITRSFERYAALAEARSRQQPFDPEELRQRLDAVNLGDNTLQTIIFEPAALRLHLCVGQCPASRGPMRSLDLAPLLKADKRR